MSKPLRFLIARSLRGFQRSIEAARLFRRSWLVCLILLLAFPPSLDADDSDKTLTVVCSTTQIADFARQVVGDRWKVVCVLAPGEDPHTYEVGNDDALAVGRADLCLENGWNLEGHSWMRKLANNANKPIATCVKGVKPLQIAEHDADQGQPANEPVEDPHAWFDHRNAAIYVKNIRDAVAGIDPDHASLYAARTELYLLQLRGLGRWIELQVNAIPRNNRILVTHHDAFGYFSEAYGFKALSPVGWTTGELADVSPNARQAIVQQIRDLGVKSIFVETTINRELLDGIARETGITIGGSLYSDAMGATGTAGDTYIGMMRENVLTIVQQLR